MTEDARGAPLEVFYNGACPICSREVGHYRLLAERHGVELAWTDIADGNPTPPDLDRDQALRRLHVRDASGRLVPGLAAFELIWRRLPGWRQLARFVALGPIRPLVAGLYEAIAAPALYRLHRLRMARAGTGLARQRPED